MQIQYINDWLDLPELKVTQVQYMDGNEIHLEVQPLAHKQNCSMCKRDEYVIRKGSNGLRKVRHMPAFEKKVYLLVPAIRMVCTRCQAGFVWNYACVGGKKQYTRLFQEKVFEQVVGSTGAHGSRILQAPASTIQQMHNEAIPVECERLSKQAWQQAEQNTDLVLGIDDFAIKKGHRYNTGIHDLKGGTMLDILPGRKLEDLRAYAAEHPTFLVLTPKAVVMDLAQAYHTWIKECYPTAIRIADRFHVHGYVIEAVQEVRKTVQGTLSAFAKLFLKSNHRLLNPREDSLSESSRKKLHILLGYSALLRSVWAWKESFTAWYDLSPTVRVAEERFIHWCAQGDQIQHPAVSSALKTMRNWQSEIINYHRCRWTNATVEGRHNRIKAFQRRHYFTRNLARYKAGILVECNRLRLAF